MKTQKKSEELPLGVPDRPLLTETGDKIMLSEYLEQTRKDAQREMVEKVATTIIKLGIKNNGEKASYVDLGSLLDTLKQELEK